jgi:hypothetical protein
MSHLWLWRRLQRAVGAMQCGNGNMGDSENKINEKKRNRENTMENKQNNTKRK